MQVSDSSLPTAPPAFFEYKEDGGHFPNPPSYNVATTLPSYDEAERSKEEATIPLVAGRVIVRLILAQLLKTNRKNRVSGEMPPQYQPSLSLRLGGRLCGQG